MQIFIRRSIAAVAGAVACGGVAIGTAAAADIPVPQAELQPPQGYYGPPPVERPDYPPPVAYGYPPPVAYYGYGPPVAVVPGPYFRPDGPVYGRPYGPVYGRPYGPYFAGGYGRYGHPWGRYYHR